MCNAIQWFGVLYLKTHIGARNNVGNRTLRFYIKVHIKINLMDPILLLFWMILCKLQSPAPSWWKQEQSTKVSVLDMISKANFKVALASSVFMQMADAMEGGNHQWGSKNNIKNIPWSNKMTKGQQNSEWRETKISNIGTYKAKS